MIADAVMDVSHHEAPALSEPERSAAVDQALSLFKARGGRAVVAKATQGARYKDPTFDLWKACAASTGLLFGAFHFGDGTPWQAQANAFLSRLGANVCPFPGFHALDCERCPPEQGPSMRGEQAHSFQIYTREAVGHPEPFYVGAALGKALFPVADSVLAACPLWIAQYGVVEPDWPKAVWSRWTLWQHTDRSPIPGLGTVDMSHFDGTEDDLRRLFGVA